MLINMDESDVSITTEGRIPLITFSERVWKALENSIKNTVVAQFLSGGFGYKVLKYGIDSVWKPKGGYHIVDLENKYFLVQFDQEMDYHLLYWMVLG